jgi:hypothetical protein
VGAAPSEQRHADDPGVGAVDRVLSAVTTQEHARQQARRD